MSTSVRHILLQELSHILFFWFLCMSMMHSARKLIAVFAWPYRSIDMTVMTFNPQSKVYILKKKKIKLLS